MKTAIYSGPVSLESNLIIEPSAGDPSFESGPAELLPIIHGPLF